MRLSASSLAGTARTLVAVGTVSDSSMLLTIRAATPRRMVTFAPAGTVVDAGLAGTVLAGAVLTAPAAPPCAALSAAGAAAVARALRSAGAPRPAGGGLRAPP